MTTDRETDLQRLQPGRFVWCKQCQKARTITFTFAPQVKYHRDWSYRVGYHVEWTERTVEVVAKGCGHTIVLPLGADS